MGKFEVTAGVSGSVLTVKFEALSSMQNYEGWQLAYRPSWTSTATWLPSETTWYDVGDTAEVQLGIDTDYVFNVRILQGTQQILLGSRDITTPPGGFYWGGVGTMPQSGEETTTYRADDWNTMVECLHSARLWAVSGGVENSDWLTTYGSYNATRANSGDIFTANRFNAVSINSGFNTIVSSGDPCTASLIIDLGDSIGHDGYLGWKWQQYCDRVFDW